MGRNGRKRSLSRPKKHPRCNRRAASQRLRRQREKQRRLSRTEVELDIDKNIDRAKAIKEAVIADAEAASTEAGASSTQTDVASAEAGLSSTHAEAANTETGASSIQADAAITEAGTVNAQAETSSTEVGTSSIQPDVATTEIGTASTQPDVTRPEIRTYSVNAKQGIAFVTNKQSASTQPDVARPEIRTYSKARQEKKIQGRRIIDVNFFVTQLVKLNKHSRYGCTINDLIIVSEEKDDFLSSFLFKCKLCHFEERVWTENPENEPSINSDALDGLLSTGCGYVNMQNFFAKMQVPTPSTDFEKEYGKRLAQEMKEAKKREMKEAKQLEKEAKRREMVEAKKREKEAKRREMEEAKIRKLEASVFGNNNNNNNITTKMELPVNEIRCVGTVIVPEIRDERINAGHAAQSSGRLVGTLASGEFIVPDAEIQSAGVTVALQEMQNLVNVVGSGSSANQCRIMHEVISSKPYVASSALAPAKQCEMQDMVCSKDSLGHFPNYQDLGMYGQEKTPLSTIVSQTAASTSSQMPIGLPAQLHPHLEVLKLRMVEKKLALNIAVRTSKEIQHLVKLQASAKFQKEQQMKAFEEATARQKALRLNDAGERLFVTDVRDRAWSEVQKALSMEKYAAESLEKATNKLVVSLETLVAAMTQEEQALFELEMALRGLKNNGAVPNSETNKYPKSAMRELNVEHVIAGDTNSINKEQTVKQDTLETENNLDSAVVVKEEIEVDDDYSVEGLT